MVCVIGTLAERTRKQPSLPGTQQALHSDAVNRARERKRSRREMDYHRSSIVSVVLLVCALLLAAPSVACAGGPPPIVGGILLGGLVVATALVAMLWGAIIGAFQRDGVSP